MTGVWRRAGHLGTAAPWTPSSQQKALQAGQSIAELLQGEGSPEDCLRRHSDVLDDLTGSLAGLSSLDGHFGRLRDNLSAERAGLDNEIEILAHKIEQIGEGKVPLSRETGALIALLDEAGIEAEPLSSLVEVVDEDWQYATHLYTKQRFRRRDQDAGASVWQAVVEERGGLNSYLAQILDLRRSPDVRSGSFARRGSTTPCAVCRSGRDRQEVLATDPAPDAYEAKARG